MSGARHEQLARRLADGLCVLDTLHLGEPGVVASYLIEGPESLALVDVGPASTAETLLAAIRAAGHTPHDVTTILLTHIHLDHAGATGTLLAQMPHARVYVHPLGVSHLIDPSRLMASASRIYGERMSVWWGSMVGVPADRIDALADGERVVAGNRTLVALHTPGHAVHHIAYYDPRNGVAFPGDVAGVRLEGMSYVRPPTPPPDLNLDDWRASIERLRGLALSELYLPHFGRARELEAHWDQLSQRLDAWADLVLVRMRRGETTDEIATALSREEDARLAPTRGPGGEAAQLRRRYEHATNYRMTVEGYERYFRKARPDLLER